MDPTSFLELMKTGGPYAVSALLFMWLKLERTERVAAQKDATEQREKRVAEQKLATEALAELGEATRIELRELRTREEARR